MRAASHASLALAKPEDGSAVSAATVDEVQPGTVIGDFEIVEQIGAGGISRVFRARQLSLSRDVALKVTEHEAGDNRGLAEGSVMAALQHDNIVRVHSEFAVGSCRVLAMELIDGPSLADAIRVLHSEAKQWPRLQAVDCQRVVRQLAPQHSGRAVPAVAASDCNASIENRHAVSQFHRRIDSLARAVNRCWKPEPEGLRSFACSIVRQLALALQHTHEQGVFHGDIKPANVLLSIDAKPLLADFNVSARAVRAVAGAARAIDVNQDTQSGESTESPVGGTLLYMAPERLAVICGQGTASAIDGRADVYSLGLVLFELLTGGWPFPEHHCGRDPLLAPRELYASRLTSAVEFSQGEPRVGRQLQTVIRHCLKANPNDRYQSAGELADDLRRVLECQSLRWAEPLTVARRFSFFLRRHRIASLAGSLLIALTAVCTMSVAESKRLPGEATAAAASLKGTPDQTFANADERYAMAARLEESGRNALALNQLGQAATDLQQAVVMDPQNVAAQHNLGIACFRLGRFAEAKAAFDAALELGVRSGRTYSYRAATRLAMGDLAGARDDFEAALRVATADDRQEIEANYQEFLAREAPGG